MLLLLLGPEALGKHLLASLSVVHFAKQQDVQGDNFTAPFLFVKSASIKFAWDGTSTGPVLSAFQ